LGPKEGHGDSAAGGVTLNEAGAGLNNGGTDAVAGFGAVGSGVSLFSKRTLPVWLSVRTGSASAMSCSIFLIGSAAAPGFSIGATMLAGGRRTTPCVAGKVGIAASPASTLGSFAVAALLGGGAGGSGVVFFGLTGAALKGGGVSGAGRGFLALKKMSGQGMVVRSYAQFQAIKRVWPHACFHSSAALLLCKTLTPMPPENK
jgi:hypothetical protein